jgi:hypothetical protein
MLIEGNRVTGAGKFVHKQLAELNESFDYCAPSIVGAEMFWDISYGGVSFPETSESLDVNGVAREDAGGVDF